MTPAARRGLRHLRQGVAQPRQRGRMRFSRRDLPLFWRAVHQNRAAEFGAKAGEAEHHGKRAGAHRGIGVGQRQAFGLDQQPVQPGDGEARGLDGGADFRGFGGGDFLRPIISVNGAISRPS